ncbi:hypothetical protein EDD22DRAFT_849980 [Suillus occidentalis]|nr:hypothetical protein EDD22DRAFT_849980 [Suillus occidentalis]
MAISSKPFSTNNLSDILFHVTQMPGVTLPVQLAIRSVAFLLKEAAENEMADKVAKLILTAVSPQIAKIQDTSESISSTALHLNIAATKLQDIAKATTEESPDSTNKPSSINSQLEKMQEAVTSLGTQIRDLPMQGGYKAALMTGLNEDSSKNPQLVQRATRNAIKARQILIDIPTDSPLAPGKVSHAQLTEKIKQALATITKEGAPDLETRAVTQFRNGGTVIEMFTTQAVTFLKDQHNKTTFLQALDPGAILKDRAYTVIIQFVPLTFDPSKPEHICNLEKENEWEENSVTTA